jgi:D-3-phosphoglycerate dehydrogenase
MKIAILDDYQNAVRQPRLFLYWTVTRSKCSTIRRADWASWRSGWRPLRRAGPDPRTHRLPRALLNKLPNLKLISQTGKLAGHVDVAAATALGIAIAEGVGSPVAPAELTWALIMAASRKIVPYASNLKDGLWQTASINPQLNGLGGCCAGGRWRSGVTARSARWWPAMARPSACA